NPLPADGNILVEFPRNFTSINCTAALATGVDGGLDVWVTSDGYTVRVRRAGDGTEVQAGAEITLELLDGIKNQEFEGLSAVFPRVKTTLADTEVAIDESSGDFNRAGRPAAVLFTPGSFGQPPTVELASRVAGHEGAATVNLSLSNPLPADGNILVEFPRNFTSINCTAALATGVDGGLDVWVTPDGYTVRVRRAGDGTEVQAGAEITLELLDGIKNQEFEGLSAVFPRVKTTLADTEVAVDSALEGLDTPPFFFVAAPLSSAESRILYDVAGMETSITFVFTTVNPLPQRAVLCIEFPIGFTAASPTLAVSAELGILAVVGLYPVVVERVGSGDLLPGRTNISLTLSSVINRGSAGDTGSFNLTTYVESSLKNR
ncbi:unnamed protein product, partial [Hapterophycus canaliculatus]